MLKPFTVRTTTNCGKFLKIWEYQTTLPISWETFMEVKKQHLEPGMEQWTGSKLGKEYDQALCCHPAYLTYMQSISCEMLDWMNHKLESRLCVCSVMSDSLQPHGLYSPWSCKESDMTDFHIHVYITCLLRNLYTGQEATIGTGHGTTDWFQIGKGVHQAYILSPCLFNLYAEYIMWNARLDEAQAGIKIAGEISITSDTQVTPPLWQKVKRN